MLLPSSGNNNTNQKKYLVHGQPGSGGPTLIAIKFTGTKTENNRL